MAGIRAIAIALGVAATAHAAPVGTFIDHRDIGTPKLAGSTTYDARTGTYRVTGGGTNMWADHDDFQFAWKRMSGDLDLQTQLAFETPMPAPTAGGFLHRKGGLVVRQDLDPDSAYVDAIRMSNAQLSLQYREVKGGQTRLIWINTHRQDAVRLVKIGDYAYLYVPGPDGKLHRAGGSFRLKLTGSYYVGLGVCAHDNSTSERMAFHALKLTALPAGRAKPLGGSTLQTINIANTFEQTALYHVDQGQITVGGWSPDAKWVSFTSGGIARRAEAWDSEKVEAGALTRVAPASGATSPDGKWRAEIVPAGASARDVALRIVPIENGAAQPGKAQTLVKLVGSAASLPRAAWSPDSKTIAFVSED